MHDGAESHMLSRGVQGAGRRTSKTGNTFHQCLEMLKPPTDDPSDPERWSRPHLGAVETRRQGCLHLGGSQVPSRRVSPCGQSSLRMGLGNIQRKSETHSAAG
jgi:hypothetical protein